MAGLQHDYYKKDIGARLSNNPEIRGLRIAKAFRLSVKTGKAVEFSLKFFPVAAVSGFRGNMKTVMRTFAAVTFPEYFDSR